MSTDGATPATSADHTDHATSCYRPRPVMQNCARCAGDGRIKTDRFDDEGKPIKTNCPECNGRGQLPTGEIEQVVGGAHTPKWVWIGSVMTNRVQCTTCGQSWEHTR